MPIQKLYRAQCGNLECLARFDQLFTSYQDAEAAALERGWSVYPLLCDECNSQAKEDTVNHKIAGLYVNLVKALNALEEFGEEVQGEYAMIHGNSASVLRDPGSERWNVVQEG